MNFKFKDIVSYLVIIVVVLLIRTFIVTPVRVDGKSMFPTLDNNDILILKKYDNSIDRFDIVVLKYKGDKLVKRVIGLPGEHVKILNNKLYINGNVIDDAVDVSTNNFDISKLGVNIIPEGYYFVMGDNRGNSSDSRIIGLISEDDIIGISDFRLFPFNKFGKI